MGLRDRLGEGLKEAMRDRQAVRLSTLRLISAAIKDRDIALRAEGREDGASDEEIMGILAKMVKQRQESARAYEEGARLELAEGELAEIKVIEEFLPKQLTPEETAKAVEDAPSEIDTGLVETPENAEPKPAAKPKTTRARRPKKSEAEAKPADTSVPGEAAE